jgi:hypothetical protein
MIYGFLLAVVLFLSVFAGCIYYAKREHAKWLAWGKIHGDVL